MSSIMTNTSAMTALKTLAATNKAIETTQTRISTGYAVSSASDNAAYWSIATTMRSDNSALGTVQDALGLGAATLDVAYTGMESAIEVVDEIKTKLVAAKEPGVDKAKIQSEITELQAQLEGIATSASFNGENYLHTATGLTAGTESVVASFTRDASGNVSIETIDVDTTATVLTDVDTAANGILSQDRTGTNANVISIAGGANDITIDGTTTDAELDDMIEVVDAALTEMTEAGTTLGASKKRIDMQSDFVGNLMDAIDRGVGQLVDADMSEESTRLQALQVQQQLGIQSLSMANQNAQTILSLFR
ncbi:flagellin [Oricola indica]|uniref:flagellin N-terminal helical domain-containing protein n=1 Tax=Oricola indica TaxID=2872591 RepID=UPI003CCC3BB1